MSTNNNIESNANRNIESEDKKIAIVGSGIIGRSWAVIFAKAGYLVCMYDVEEQQISAALASCRKQLNDFENGGFNRVRFSTAEQVSRLISGTNDLQEALDGAIYVQECTPENLDLKRKVFAQLDKYSDKDTILASSTSCIVPSLFTDHLEGRARCLVAHPVNPPHFVPLVEIVPAPWTDASIIERTKAILLDVGQAPVTAKKEINGFILNRLQYALLMEAWRLVEDGVCSPEDVETTVCKGLGLRYAVIGPFETMHLNATGVKDYCERYGENIVRVCEDEGGPRPFEGRTMNEIHQAMCKIVPVDKLDERRRWRDERLGELSKLTKGEDGETNGWGS